MLKKLLTLSLVAVMLSTAALAAPGVLDGATPVYAAESDAIVIVSDTAEITDNGLAGEVNLNLTSTVARDSAVLITAVYDGNYQLLNAEINSEVTSIASWDNTATIELPAVKTTDNNKYIVKFYWWESKSTLAPVVESVEKVVMPAAPATWSGEAATEDAAPTLNADGYYEITTGEQLAWFSNKVDEDATVKAKLMNDIYLNYFDTDADGNFDEEWYETEANVTVANSWNDYKMASFAGEFDGSGKTIYGLYMQGGENTGFFSSVSGGTVKNVTFKGAYVVSTTTHKHVTYGYYNGVNYEPVAIVAANVVTADTTSTFNNITTYGKITATAAGDVLTSGGIIGRADSVVNMTDCTNRADIIHLVLNNGEPFRYNKTEGATRSTYVAVVKCGIGGIIGLVGDKDTTNDGANVTLTRCFNYGNLIVPYSNDRIGGIVGHFRNGSLDLTSTCGNAGKIRSLNVNGQMVGTRTDSYTNATAGGTNHLTGGSVAVYDSTVDTEN